METMRFPQSLSPARIASSEQFLTAHTMPRMIFPRVLADMEGARYRFDGYGVCSACHKPIEVWVPHSTGQRLKLNAMSAVESPVVPHRCNGHMEPTQQRVARKPTAVITESREKTISKSAI